MFYRINSHQVIRADKNMKRNTTWFTRKFGCSAIKCRNHIMKCNLTTNHGNMNWMKMEILLLKYENKNVRKILVGNRYHYYCYYFPQTKHWEILDKCRQTFKVTFITYLRINNFHLTVVHVFFLGVIKELTKGSEVLS